jgi:hypothetical protein
MEKAEPSCTLGQVVKLGERLRVPHYYVDGMLTCCQGHGRWRIGQAASSGSHELSGDLLNCAVLE